MALDHEKNFGFLIQDVARLMKCAFDRRIKELGLTRSQWFAIAFLRRSDGLTQQQLADQMDIRECDFSEGTPYLLIQVCRVLTLMPKFFAV